MKSICIVTTISLTLKTFFMEIAQYLHETGNYQITFICNQDEEFRGALPSYIKYVPIKMKRGIDPFGCISILKLYKHFRNNKYSVIQYATPNAAFYASIASKLAKAPIRLYSQLGLLYPEYLNLFRIIFKFIERITCYNSTHVEPVSQSNLDIALGDKLFPEGKGHIIWNGSTNGVNLKKFDIGMKKQWNNNHRSSMGIKDDAFVVGYVGRITKAKGINEFLEAGKKLIEKYQDINLIFIGEFEYKKKLDAELLKWAHSNKRIFFVGATNKVEMYFAVLDILVLPSYREGFGSVVIEAEAMGVPVVVSDIAGPADAMKDGITGIKISPKDHNSIIKAVEKLYLNHFLCNQFGNNGRKFIENNFDQEILLKYILQRRDEMLNE